MALAGQLYRSLYPYGPTDDPGDLTFPAGAVIMVTSQDAGDGWWEGELNGASGTFPASYVVSLSEVKKSFTAPEDTPATETVPVAPVAAPAAAAVEPPSTGQSPKSALAKADGRRKKSLSWSLEQNSEEYTFGKSEYARSMDGLDHMTMQRNHFQWEKEEAEEKIRQMFVAFEIWERELPPGTKCPQRLEYEAEQAKEEAEKAEKRRKFKEAREAKRRAQQAAEAAELNPIPEPVPPPPTEPPPPVVVVTPAVDAVPEAEAPRRAEESQPTPAIDLAAPFVEMLDQLRRVSSELGKDDERGQEGYTVRFRDLDVDDRRRFSIELCQAGASHPECNRYKDILPYDEFRVPINGTQGYINASFVPGLLPGAPTYLAAQGPKPETIGHFWKMIAEHRCVVIAMLTRCIESNKRKCEEYWPAAGGSLFFDADEGGPAVGVVGHSEVERELWTERKFTVVTDEGSHDVVQLHFTGWPDHGVPDRPADAIKFVQETMRVERAANASSRAPIAVHCSAGVGRTGVFSVLHAIMTYLPSYGGPNQPELFDITSMVRHCRQSRRYMVQTIDQFRFCFAAAIEVFEQYIEAVRATANAPPQPRPAAQDANLSVQVLSKQLKQSLRREFDANRARSELQKDLLEMTTGMRDSAAAKDIQEDLALARQRLMQMTKRIQEQGKEIETMHRDLEAKDLHVKQMASIVGQLEMEVADKDEELTALKQQLAAKPSGNGGALPNPADTLVDYIAVAGADDENEAGYVDLLPDDDDELPKVPRDSNASLLDDEGGQLGFGTEEAKPTMILDGGGSESDSEL